MILEYNSELTPRGTHDNAFKGEPLKSDITPSRVTLWRDLRVTDLDKSSLLE